VWFTLRRNKTGDRLPKVRKILVDSFEQQLIFPQKANT
jgi:hypothetical protein